MNEAVKRVTLRELAELVRARLVGDPDHPITGIADLESAGSDDASFLVNPRYRTAMLQSKAGVICIDQNTDLVDGKSFLISDNPDWTFQKIVQLFLPPEFNESGFKGIHPTAVVHAEAQIGSNVNIGPYAVIDKGVTIGAHTSIGPFVSIGQGVKIGEYCVFHPHVVIRERCIIGNRVIIQPAAIIGSCGFGYTTSAQGRHTKLDQVGCVILEDDVEIGAGTTIDRARFKATCVGRGTKIDNLVQVGHNVILGEDNLIVSQTGISGSVKTGKNVILGGQAGVVGHIEIPDGTMIAARGGVSKSLAKAGKYSGSPVMPLAEYNRQQVQFRKISEHVKKIEELEKRIKLLEELSDKI